MKKKLINDCKEIRKINNAVDSLKYYKSCLQPNEDENIWTDYDDYKLYIKLLKRYKKLLKELKRFYDTDDYNGQITYEFLTEILYEFGMKDENIKKNYDKMFGGENK